MKALVTLFSLLVFCISISYSQSNPGEISDLIVRYRNLDDDMAPPSVNDPAFQNRKVIMEISFTVNNPDLLNEIVIKGSETGAENAFIDMKLIAKKAESKTQLEYNGKSYVMEGNTMTIEQEIPESMLKKKRKLTVKAINKSNVITKTLTKENY